MAHRTIVNWPTRRAVTAEQIEAAIAGVDRVKRHGTPPHRAGTVDATDYPLSLPYFEPMLWEERINEAH